MGFFSSICSTLGSCVKAAISTVGSAVKSAVTTVVEKGKKVVDTVIEKGRKRSWICSSSSEKRIQGVLV